MKTDICCVAVLMCTLGIVFNVAAAENNSSLAPLIPEPNGVSKNNQEQALRDFLALYALTQQDSIANNGTWEELDVKNAGARAALFGSGDQSGGLISRVLIGGDTVGNPFDNIRSVLAALNITANNKNAHNNHFHIFIQAPTRVDITQNLLAENNGVGQTASESRDAIRMAAQAMIDDMQPQLNLNQGDINMLFMDVPPDVPAQYAPVMIAQATQAQDPAKTDRTIGVCQLVNSMNPLRTFHPESPVYSIAPGQAVSNYFSLVEKKYISYENNVKVTLLQGPEHGELKEDGGQDYRYTPAANYIGSDRATFIIEIGGLKVKAVYHFKVIDGGAIGGTEITDKKNCPKGWVWKISTTSDTNGNSTITSVEYQSPFTEAGNTTTDTAALASTLGSSLLSGFAVDTSSVTLNFADLPGGAVGQATGNTITLDDNAAGHNWFIDATPWDNSEYLATSNPNEWVAKAGSAAEGKMDMLSVLLHEYGHALGIEHSADSHDYMATTLIPGVRRMPSAEELALMQQLISVAKDGLAGNNTPDNNPMPLPIPLGAGFGIAFLGRMRNSRFGGTSIDVVGAPTITQYAVAANATFTNLNTPAGWNTQGSVDIASGTATLNEVSTSQTRLSQVFMLNDKDRYLSFTLSGTALDNQTGAPDDAFEVALLDATTGLSVLGGNGLTRTDAFLNLQGDGTQNAADCVTCIYNADGSRTYRVDLTGIAAGTVANLSFDLLGFGASSSQVTLRDIRVSGLPQLHDDAASLAEDNLLSFDPFAQADAQLRPLLASQIVAAPAHGVLAMNADGTFSYTPNLNYFGTDSFSYHLSDGPLDSNLATVSLTVTPVNDAPVVADVALTTTEDTVLVIALGAYASDVDSTTLTPQIVTGPAHGVLAQNADGTYSYAPDANYNGADSFTYKVNDGNLASEQGDSNIATVTLAVTSVNDAPVAVDTQAATDEDTPLNLNLLAAASDVDGDVLTPVIIAGPLHGQLVSNADGTFTYTPDANYNGTDSFTYKVNDGELDSNFVTVSLTIAAVNDAPVVISASVTGQEDTPYIFYWSDFRVSDVDSVDLAITINTLPTSGLLQYYDGIQWLAVLAGQRITKADIDAGWLCFGPDANESGFDGYGTTGTGNLLQDYASFTYQADDGPVGAQFIAPANQSDIVTMTINITPVADTPSLALSAPVDAYGATATRFSTGWEIAPNRNPTFTILPQSTLEGWNVVRETGDTAQEAFVIWSTGDKMKDANNTNQIVAAASGNGNNWLEIGNANGLGHQTWGIKRTVDTRAGVTYNLSLDYAGRLGYGIDFTSIGIYVDGVRIATYASTSPNTALNWEAVNFGFTGNGASQLRVGTPCPRDDRMNRWVTRWPPYESSPNPSLLM